MYSSLVPLHKAMRESMPLRHILTDICHSNVYFQKQRLVAVVVHFSVTHECLILDLIGAALHVKTKMKASSRLRVLSEHLSQEDDGTCSPRTGTWPSALSSTCRRHRRPARLRAHRSELTACSVIAEDPVAACGVVHRGSTRGMSFIVTSANCDIHPPADRHVISCRWSTG